MKETKVYIGELPEDCTDCPCYDFDIGGCQCKDPHFTYQSINRFKGCPLIDIKTHDRELVKEVCEKIKERAVNMYYAEDQEDDSIEQAIVISRNEAVDEFIDILDQKEYEDE